MCIANASLGHHIGHLLLYYNPTNGFSNRTRAFAGGQKHQANKYTAAYMQEHQFFINLFITKGFFFSYLACLW